MGIIDCDVHPMPTGIDEIRKYMSWPWSKLYKGGSYKYFSQPIQENRIDAKQARGGPVASDPEYVVSNHLDIYDIDYSILLPRAFVSSYPNYDLGNEIAKAHNDWLMDKWLEKHNNHGRFKGSILVNPQDPIAAVEEIKRCVNHPHMVQVVVDSGARAAFGKKQYHPIYEACQEYGIPFAIHPGTDGVGVNDSNSLGYPSHFIEYHTLLSTAFQSHLVSFITEGVFDKFPALKVVLVEGGVSWIPPLLWRLDAEYKALREEVPWMKKRPHEYLRSNIRVTTQPLEVPDKREYMWSMLEAMDAQHILMFSSDYAHWDFDSPDYIRRSIPSHLHNSVFYNNAKELYSL